MPDSMALATEARNLADEIRRHGVRIVLAESCTAGLACAALAAIPGISEFLCGSAVTYRDDAKRQWLDVSANDLANFTAVSEPVARQMARGVLEHTPEADWSAAITGHLGPDAPAGFDGVIYIAVARRYDSGPRVTTAARKQLTAADRVSRQSEAATAVLTTLRAEIAARPLASGSAK
jgi:PncC family amidohydrolase